MSEENKKTNIEEELTRAKKSLDSAEILYEHGNYSDAISRLYYFLFHIVKALLFSIGLEPKSHEGLLILFGKHFVKTGIFLPKDSHTISQLMKYREEADYNTSYVFTGEDYLEFRTKTDELSDKIIKYLVEKNYYPKEMK
jgi:uncharacterized protein (UPF0332 family)